MRSPADRPFRAIATLALVLLTVATVAVRGIPSPLAALTAPKPAGQGTPVSGASQTPVTHPDGHSESVVAAGGVTYIGSNGGNIYALQAANGALLWQRALGEGAANVYTAAGGIVVALAGQEADTVYGLRADTGATVWQHRLDIFVSGFAASQDALYVSGNLRASTGGAALYAIRSSDGAQLWRYDNPGVMPRSLAFADGVVYAHPVDNRGGLFPHTPTSALVALRAGDGQQLWSYPFADGIEFAGPAVADGVAYLTTETVSGDQVAGIEVDALQSATGARLWQFRSAGDGPDGESAPMVANGVVYISGQNAIYTARARDGALLWRATKGSSDPAPFAQPLIADGVLSYSAGLGTIYAVRAADGVALWQQHINNSVLAMTADHGHLIVMTQLNSVYALRASDGTLLWQQAIAHFNSLDVNSPPYAVADGVVYVGTDRGRVQAVRASDGAALWRYDIPPVAVLPHPVYSASVQFTPPVDYADALRAVTDLGLHTFGIPCSTTWQPQGDATPWNHTLLVASTPTAPLGWLTPLGNIAGVQRVQVDPIFHCPAMQAPPLGALLHLPADQAGTYLRVTFSGAITYDAALARVDDLGFRLANPCYERQPTTGATPWSPMGQEDAFARTSSLALATTAGNSTEWAFQLASTQGVTHVEIGYAPRCA